MPRQSSQQKFKTKRVRTIKPRFCDCMKPDIKMIYLSIDNVQRSSKAIVVTRKRDRIGVLQHSVYFQRRTQTARILKNERVLKK